MVRNRLEPKGLKATPNKNEERIAPFPIYFKHDIRGGKMSHASQLYIRIGFSNLREITAARGIDKILGVAPSMMQIPFLDLIS